MFVYFTSDLTYISPHVSYNVKLKAIMFICYLSVRELNALNN